MRKLALIHCAAFILGTAAAPPSDSANELLKRANAAYLGHRPMEAVNLYREFLQNHADRQDVRTYLGAALFNAGRTQEALEEANQVIAADPRAGRAHVLIGRIHAELQHWSDAQGHFEIAERIDPRDREAWYFSGRAYYTENRFEQAIAAFEKALPLGSEQSRIYENLGLSYEALGRPAEAEKAYRHAIRLAAEEFRPHLAYGLFLYKAGRLEEALPLFRQAVALDARSVDALFELGKALLQTGELASATGALERALKLSDQCRVRQLLIKAYERAERPGDAERHLAGAAACQNTPR